MLLTDSFVIPKQFTFMDKLSSQWKTYKSSIEKSLRSAAIAEAVSEYDLDTLLALGPIDINERQFLINGWRWHTASVLRDLNRFSDLIKKIKVSNILISPKETKLIRECCDFVFGFNWKALQRVENEIFFPWLQEILPKIQTSTLFNSISHKQASIAKLSICMTNLCNNLENIIENTDDDKTKMMNSINKLIDIENTLSELTSFAMEIQTIQVKLSFDID